MRFVTMPLIRFFVVVCAWIIPFFLTAQRSYRSSSVLASGSWYKLGVKKEGIYKIDIPFLNNMGIATQNLSSSSIRLFGNGGAMLAETNNADWIDDLRENAIMVVDGGDGMINGADYILFYASGPDHWVKDSANLRFTHRKNLYSDFSYYFITIGGIGKRINIAPAMSAASTTVTNFSERYFHELDTVNFLASGKEWYGEEFANIPGRTVSRDFNIPFSILANSQATLVSQAVARSVGNSSRFDIKINNQLIGQSLISAISGSTYDLFAQQTNNTFSTSVSQPTVAINYTYVPGSFNAQGWLNWFEFFSRRNLSLNGSDQLAFRDWLSVSANSRPEFVIGQATASTRVWDVTDPLNVVQVTGIFSGSEFRFVSDATRLKEYIAFNSTGFLSPVSFGKIANQDLHAASPVDYIIVTHASLFSQAERVAAFHQQKSGLRTKLVTTEQVFNEFASGSPDPVAIRDFVKMYHDKYRNSPGNQLKYLLLMGDASYDYKDRLNNNTSLVPAWENGISLDPLATYASDDFFGFLDDNENINDGAVTNYLDIGIGRVPAKTFTEAKNFVDKLVAYHDKESFGPWRNQLTFIADDEDNNLHLQDAEIFTTTSATILPLMNQQKIYLDAYRQESGSGGSRYPTANLAINNQVYNGTLIWNYNGHGGSRRLAEETILDQEIINSWNNPNRLPLFITATCDFAPYDNPAVQSVGENLLLRQKTGGIALMTTTRVVFAFSNRIMNNNYLQIALQPDANGKYKSLGDAMREAKNFTYQTSGDVANNRKFTLLGDPAMTLAYPTWKVRATKVNGIDAAQADTLSATETVTMEGEVTDIQGNLASAFTGTVYPVLFDKPQTVTTLANDPASQVTTFSAQTNVLFKGKASVTNGRFNFSFKVPKDINYQFGNGRLSLYADNGVLDGNGLFTNFIVGGIGTGFSGDKEGPVIKPYLNDERFVNGGLTNELPVLVLRLSDSSGINTTGLGIGHDLVATLDNDNNRFFILNDFFQNDLNTYQQGTVRFQLPELEPGPHQLHIKAWDVMNNSAEVVLEFIVARDEELTLSHVLNYPNPFTTNTRFWFEHNKPGQNLQVRLQIFTVTGRIIKMIEKTINTAGNRSSELEWNGRDEYGDKVGKGVYLYKLSVIAPGNQRKEKIERLVVF